MEEISTFKAVRIDDTAYWRLVVYISRSGMSAYLKNEEETTAPVEKLFSEEWSCDETGLLKMIETAVYDHPQLLDDFSTDIIISTDKALWIPQSVIEEGETEEGLYNEVYRSEEEDIFIDEIGDMECLYTLIPGLQSFIRRTLPGARTWCQQSVGVQKFLERKEEMPRVYIDIREMEADYIIVRGKQLLLSVTHIWRDKMDLVYHLFNMVDVYGLDLKECQVSLSGVREVMNELLPILREKVTYVMKTMLPSIVSKSEMPLSVAMLVSRSHKEKS